MKPEIVEIQSWRYKTIVVTKRQQQTTISNKKFTLNHSSKVLFQAVIINKENSVARQFEILLSNTGHVDTY